jgi:hypothetical protein
MKMETADSSKTPVSLFQTVSQDNGLHIHHCDYLTSLTVEMLQAEASSLVGCATVSLGTSHCYGCIVGVTHLWSSHMGLLYYAAGFFKAHPQFGTDY